MIGKNIPNIITVIRLILVGPFLFYLLSDNYEYAFYVFTVAGLSDGLDGLLARRYGWISRFGCVADPLADKLLMMTSFLALTYHGKLPIWLTSLVITRDVVIVAGVSGLYYLFRKVDFTPTPISKLNTALQIILIFLLLFELAYDTLPSQLISTIMICMVVTTVVSFVHYVLVWGATAFKEWQHHVRVR